MPGQPSLGLPELFFARDLPGFGKGCPARFALKHGPARVQASVADQTWRGMTSRLAL